MAGPIITIDLDKDEAEQLQHELSDFLCWAQGFTAATPDNPERHPWGVEAIRTLRGHINRALKVPF